MSSRKQTGHYTSEDTVMIVSSCTQTSLAGVPLHSSQNGFDKKTNGELHHVLCMSDQDSVDGELCRQCYDSLVVFDGFSSALQSLDIGNNDDHDHEPIRVLCDKSVGTEQASADPELFQNQQDSKNADTLQQVSFSDLVNGSYHSSVSKSDSPDPCSGDIQHSDTQLDNSELLGAVGGYVNGFELEQSVICGLIGREFKENWNYNVRCGTQYQLTGFGRFESLQSLKSVEPCRMPNDNDDGVFYHGSSPTEDDISSHAAASNGIRSNPDCKHESDLCLDDYIDADMHLSPAAERSLSSSSSSLLSVDGDVVISESDGNDRCEKSRGGKSLRSNVNFNGLNAACQDEFRHGVSSGERLNSCLDSLAFEGSNDSVDGVHVTHLVQSSGHPSTSSFDSLVASLPSPSGYCGDVACASLGASEQFFHCNDDQKSDFSMPSDTLLLSSRELNLPGSNGMYHCQNQSSWLSNNEKSGFYVPGLECKSCSGAMGLGRFGCPREPADEINQSLCVHNLGADHSLSITPLNASNSSEQPFCSSGHLGSSVDRTIVNGSCDGDEESCAKFLGRHVSDETIGLPYLSKTCTADIGSFCSKTGRQVDRNSNRCCRMHEEAFSGHQGMRLSTSLTFKKSTVECDQRLTQSLHQPLPFEDDESDTSLKYTLDGSKDQTSLSSDVNCSSPLSRMSQLAIDRLNLNKLLRSLGIRNHQIEMNCLIESSCVTSKSSVCEYLVACSRAGTSAQQVISRVSKLTGGRVYGKFFNFYPRRCVDLKSWLADWLQLGSVALVTARMERKSGDATRTWQHLAVDSVQPEGIAIGCPPEVFSEDVLMSFLSGGPLVEVDRNEIISRWHSNCDLNELMMVSDSRWHELNVLGQTVNVLRENRPPTVSGYKLILTPHVILPTQIRSGITIFTTVHSTAHDRLAEVSEDLPLASVDDSDADDCSAEVSALERQNVALASSTEQADNQNRVRTKSRRSKKFLNV